MLVIIEIKGTNWNLIPSHRLMRNLRRHLHQLQGYLDSAMEDMEAGRWASIAGALLYPARPASTQTTALIETVADEQAIMITWYEDANWRQWPTRVDVGATLTSGCSALDSNPV
jgi:hypothetical protein